MLRVDSSRGAEVAGARVAGGECVALRDGDRFAPFTGGSGARGPSVSVRFDAHHGVVHTVRFTSE